MPQRMLKGRKKLGGGEGGKKARRGAYGNWTIGTPGYGKEGFEKPQNGLKAQKRRAIRDKKRGMKKKNYGQLGSGREGV